ncbi:MAG: hypothetical protein KIS72_12495, partial [Luteimonas sp.]|nr:hypothetical protein [Luteimonas sp.]
MLRDVQSAKTGAAMGDMAPTLSAPVPTVLDRAVSRAGAAGVARRRPGQSAGMARCAFVSG